MQEILNAETGQPESIVAIQDDVPAVELTKGLGACGGKYRAESLQIDPAQ